MSLAKYREKRSFRKTPEPEGGKSKEKALRFVVQKHHASHLHYDFRLEMRGVLKSWAVPKGPSTDPAVKRLAMMVEDHPYDYRDFEGIIPEGNYGAGTVIVWDEGTYGPAEGAAGAGKQQQEKTLLHELHSGKLKFTLHGRKLKGAFALVKAPGRGENAWLLMKVKDRYAGTGDITRKDKSVKSGKTIEQVARSSTDVWISNRKASAKPVTVKDTRKKAAPARKAAGATRRVAGKKRKMPATPLLEAGQSHATVTLNRQKLQFTNLNKVYWPAERYTKRDMINYYHAVAPYILPYLANRPQSLNRFPDGIAGESFYQKNVEGKVAGWIPTFPYFSESEQSEKQFLVCTNEATLLYMANLGCIELHPWHSRTQHPDNPDWCVIDLDPGKNPFSRVIEAALAVKEVLDAIGIPAYPKTSGATGMHIYIPLGAKYTYEQSRMLAELLVGIVHRQIPAITSLERTPAKRKGKLYLDYLQNRQIQTIAAPYSLRPRPGATVSMPLHWDEVKPGLSPKDFDMRTAIARLKERGDIFGPVLGKGIVMERVLKKIEGFL